mgnify:CR=1 FL=1
MAVTDYNQAIAHTPEDINILVNRAPVYSELGNHTLAVADMDRVFEIDPTYAKGYLVRAYAYSQMGQEADSRGDIDWARAELSISQLAPSP